MKNAPLFRRVVGKKKTACSLAVDVLDCVYLFLTETHYEKGGKSVPIFFLDIEVLVKSWFLTFPPKTAYV